MKKTTRILTVLCLVVCLVAALCIAAACNNPTTATYSVTVKNPDGTAAAGVKVSWDSFGPQTTDANGKASISLEEGDYKISLANLPSDTSYEAVVATKDNKDVVINLVSTATTAQYTITVQYPDGSPVVGAGVGWCTIGEGGMCFFPEVNATDAQGKITMTLEIGEYHVQITSGLPAGYTYDKSEDNYYTINATAASRDVTITLVPLGNVAVDTFGTYTFCVASAEQGNVKVAFTPSVAGNYKITANGAKIVEALAYLGTTPVDEIIANYPYLVHENVWDDIEVLSDQVDNMAYEFYVIPNSTNYPVMVEVKIEKVGNSTEIEAEIVNREATETLATCPENANADESVVYLKNVDGLVKGEDGLYTLDGKVVYVQLGRAIPKSFYEAIVQWQYGNNAAPYQFYAVDDEGNLNFAVKYDFRNMICSGYANYLNSDGLYYLTDELKDFLCCWAKENWADWFVFCCVYGQADVNVGGEVVLEQYSFVECSFANDTDYVTLSFTAPADGEYKISFEGNLVAEIIDAYAWAIFDINFDTPDIYGFYTTTPFWAGEGQTVTFQARATAAGTVYLMVEPSFNGGEDREYSTILTYAWTTWYQFDEDAKTQAVEFTFAWEAGSYVISWDGDMFGNSVVYKIFLGSPDGLCIFDADETTDYGMYKAMFDVLVDYEEVKLYMLVAELAKLPADVGFYVDNFAVEFKAGNNTIEGLTTTTANFTDIANYYDITVMASAFFGGLPQGTITLEIDGQTITLVADEYGLGLEAKHVYIKYDAPVTISTDVADGETVCIAFVGAVTLGYNSYEDAWQVDSYVGVSSDVYCKITLSSYAEEGFDGNVTLTINGEAVTLVANEYGYLVANNVLVPAFATISVSTESENGLGNFGLALQQLVVIGENHFDAFSSLYDTAIATTENNSYDISAQGVTQGTIVISWYYEQENGEYFYSDEYVLDASNNYSVSNLEIPANATLCIRADGDWSDDLSEQYSCEGKPVTITISVHA